MGSARLSFLPWGISPPVRDARDGTRVLSGLLPRTRFSLSGKTAMSCPTLPPFPPEEFLAQARRARRESLPCLSGWPISSRILFSLSEPSPSAVPFVCPRLPWGISRLCRSCPKKPRRALGRADRVRGRRGKRGVTRYVTLRYVALRYVTLRYAMLRGDAWKKRRVTRVGTPFLSMRPELRGRPARRGGSLFMHSERIKIPALVLPSIQILFMHPDPLAHPDLPSRSSTKAPIGIAFMLPHPLVSLAPDAEAGEVKRPPAPGRAVMPDRGSSEMRSESFDVLLAEARRARQEKPRARREPSPRSPCRLRRTFRRTFSRCKKRGSAGPRRVARARRLFLRGSLRGSPRA